MVWAPLPVFGAVCQIARIGIAIIVTVMAGCGIVVSVNVPAEVLAGPLPDGIGGAARGRRQCEQERTRELDRKSVV